MQVYSFKLEGGGLQELRRKEKKQHRFKFEDAMSDVKLSYKSQEPYKN